MESTPRLTFKGLKTGRLAPNEEPVPEPAIASAYPLLQVRSGNSRWHPLHCITCLYHPETGEKGDRGQAGAWLDGPGQNYCNYCNHPISTEHEKIEKGPVPWSPISRPNWTEPSGYLRALLPFAPIDSAMTGSCTQHAN